MLLKLYTYFSLPALILHELSHIVMGIFSCYLFNINDSIIGKNSNGNFYALLMPKKIKKNILQSIFVPLAPLYLIIIIAFLSLFNITFFIILLYLIITYKYSFPSEGDLLHVKYYKLFKKYNIDDEQFIRFMKRKKLYRDDEFDIDLDFIE